MYAVFEDGSRQYKVSEGDVVRLDWRDAEVGTRLELDRVLLYQSGTETQIGQPTVAGVRLLGEVIDHPTVKTYIQKFRRRKTFRRFRGHRQPFICPKLTMPAPPAAHRQQKYCHRLYRQIPERNNLPLNISSSE